MRRLEALGLGPFCQYRKTFRRIELGDRAAPLADEERRRRSFMRMRARNIGIAAFDLVHQPVSQQEVERAIDGDGGRPRPAARHPIDDLISPTRRAALVGTGADPAELSPPPR